MMLDYLIKYVFQLKHLEAVLSTNETHIFIIACYIGLMAALYAMTELGIISIGSFIFSAVLILILYFIFKKQFNGVIKKLRNENDILKIKDTMNKICENNNNKYCKRYMKRREEYMKDIDKIYNEYNKNI